jgi:amidase
MSPERSRQGRSHRPATNQPPSSTPGKVQSRFLTPSSNRNRPGRALRPGERQRVRQAPPSPPENTPGPIDRRQILIGGAAVLAGSVVAGSVWLANRDGAPPEIAVEPTQPATPPPVIAAATPPPALTPTEAPLVDGQRDGWASLEETTISELSGYLQRGEVTASALVEAATWEIGQRDTLFGAVIELNPEAAEIALQMDDELASDQWRGPLHGVPVLLKDIIATGDQMRTTAGALALEENLVVEDATVVRRLREAGAVILGKTNLTEWSNIRHGGQTSGWSDRGGQTRNPYNPVMSTWGSSSGSAASVALSYVPLALGAETNGSIICPAAACGVVGMKPTVGLVSRSGVMPVSETFDSPGPLARTVSDIAIAMNILVGHDPDDPAFGERGWASPAGSLGSPVPEFGEVDYTDALDRNSLRGARLGICRQLWGMDPAADAVAYERLERLREAGAEVIEGVDIPSLWMIETILDLPMMVNAEFAAGMDAFFQRYMPNGPITSIEDVVAWNVDHADVALAVSGQNGLAEASLALSLQDPYYLELLTEVTRIAREQGMDQAMGEHELDAIIAPTAPVPTEIVIGDQTDFAGSSARAASLAGYPSITVPMGFVGDLPVGLHLSGRAFSESTLIGLAYSIEQLLQARVPPPH